MTYVCINIHSNINMADSVSASQPYFMRLTGAFLFLPTNLPTIRFTHQRSSDLAIGFATVTATLTALKPRR